MPDMASQNINILSCCVGSKYSNDWVYRLSSMVAKNCSAPYRFVCISDRDIEGIETIESTSSLQGWWAKLDYFRPGLFEGPCISLDLDITIVGDIAELQREPLTAARETRRQKKMNSSVMAWEPDGFTDRIWNPNPPASKSKREGFFGDQIYIANTYPKYHLFGDEVLMFKKHLEGGKVPLPPEAKVVFFNGEPKPHREEVMQYEWNKITWDGYDLPEMGIAQTTDWKGAVM